MTILASRPRRLAAAVLLGALASGCDRRPSEAELDARLAEVRARNAAAASRSRPEDDWTLEIQGSVARPERLSWELLRSLADSTVRTIVPFRPPYPETPVEFRGVKLAEILDRSGADPTAREVTLVAHDGFRSTVDSADLRRAPILLAVEREGAPLPRNEGGPVFLVFPHRTHPETAERYPGKNWSFYVTHVVVGTEAPRIRVSGARMLDRADLDRLDRVRLVETVGYRAWPNEPATLEGVRLRDALRAAGVGLTAADRVVVRGKAPIHRDRAKPLSLAGEDVLAQDILLVLRFGPGAEPVPARLGGPVLLAFPISTRPELVSRYGDRYWIPFVEEIEVVTR